MTKSYFVSDIHLGSNDEPRFFLFVDWLKKLGRELEVTHLFLVGDIFDLWIADHQLFIQQNQLVIDEIKRLKEQNIQIHFFEGNHDLYLKHFWQKELGVEVHPQGHLFELGEYKVYVEHGDQMDPEDKGYLALRWFLRTPFMKVFAKQAPEKLVSWLGEKAKDKSRHYTSKIKTIDDQKAKKVIRSHVQNLRQKIDFDLHISGHMHIRDDYSFSVTDQNVRLINLGTWLSQPGYFYLDNEKQVFFDIETVEKGQ